MATREELLGSLAQVVADYREGEVPPRTPELINAWLEQFPGESQDALLEALTSVLSRTYISRATFLEFLRGVAASDKITGGVVPAAYWKKANLLDIQQGGGSQADILVLFDQVLSETFGFGIADSGSADGDYIYLDDCIGTGSRLRSDVCAWLESKAPKKVNLHVITPILFMGSWWIDKRIQDAAKAAGKEILLHKWRLDRFQMENRRTYKNNCDVLWPVSIPKEEQVIDYVKSLIDAGYPPELRGAGNPGARGIFGSDEQKRLLEEAFLMRGCQIRAEQAYLPQNARPLGYHNLDNFGFGSMFVTYRNCPNNTPLALWVEQSEYPALFPRKTNADSAAEKLMKELFG
jgi:hypothetical protein